MAKKILKIEVEIDENDKIGVYRAVNYLANEYIVKSAEWEEEKWIFDDKLKPKDFLNKKTVEDFKVSKL